MPIKIDANLPARQELENENIFVMTQDRALSQEIRPLEIAIINLMPTKEATELQLLPRVWRLDGLRCQQQRGCHSLSQGQKSLQFR